MTFYRSAGTRAAEDGVIGVLATDVFKEAMMMHTQVIITGYTLNSSSRKEAFMGTLLWIVLLGIYGIGAWKFWSGFNRTNFTTGKAYLTLLWPVFLIANKAYRQNFTKAIKGS